MQPEVDLVNRLMDRCIKYIDKKCAADRYPEFTRSRVLLGHKQRRALLYCARATPNFAIEGEDARLFDLQIVWVMKSDLAELVEVEQ
jgi:hypothetical protein